MTFDDIWRPLKTIDNQATTCEDQVKTFDDWVTNDDQVPTRWRLNDNHWQLLTTDYNLKDQVTTFDD